MTSLQTFALILFTGLMIVIIRNLSWQALLKDKRQQHVLFGYTALLFFLWIFRAGIYQGLDVHFLWLSALTLTLGFRKALIAGAVALTGITLSGTEQWHMIGVNGLLGVVMPVCVSYVIFMTAFHKIPRNLFVYIFACAFFPGAIVIALKMGLLGGYYLADGLYDWQTVRDNYLILIPLLLFPEGLLNGMTMTLLIVYKPELVYTFHDKFYIDGK